MTLTDDVAAIQPEVTANLVGRRFFIGSATTTYSRESRLANRPELRYALNKTRSAFVETLSYEAAAGFRSDLSSAELFTAVRRFLTDPARSKTDVVAFYHTGHAYLEQDDLVLAFPETTADTVGTGVWASELARKLLRGTAVNNFLIILDTCFAEAGGTRMVAEAMKGLTRISNEVDSPSVAIITACRSGENATSLAFTEALIEAIDHPSAGGTEPTHLPLDHLIDFTCGKLPEGQDARLLRIGNNTQYLIPNPRYDEHLHGIDLYSQRTLKQRENRAAEIQAHVLPRAQGVDTAMEGVWLFTGRYEALRTVIRWLDAEHLSENLLVVTGGPGSGKSAVLSRLYVLSHRHMKQRVPRIDLLPQDTIPKEGSIARFIHARGRTIDDMVAAISEACNIAANTAGELLLKIQKHKGRPMALIVDAVDEAAVPSEIILKLFAPIARMGSSAKVRIIIGTRKHLLESLTTTRPIDLDDSHFADPESMIAYARKCLTDLISTSKYINADPRIVNGVAAAVAQSAGLTFLVALITSRSLALREELANPDDAAWRERLPREAATAMERDIDERLGEHAQDARNILLPLAFSEGAGLPWEKIWPALASRISGKTYTDNDIEWLIVEAGYYVLEVADGRRSAYRLYHESLAQHLREKLSAPTVHGKIYAALREVSAGSQTSRAWPLAHPYVLSYLSTHAAYAGRIDELLLDASYMLAADRSRLLLAMGRAQLPEARSAAAAYQQAVQTLATHAVDEHGTYLELAGSQYGAAELVDSVRKQCLARTWSILWTLWEPSHPHRILSRLDANVTDVASTSLNGRPVVVVATNTSKVYVLDAATGTPLLRPWQVTGASEELKIGAVDSEDGTLVGIVGKQTPLHVWHLDRDVRQRVRGRSAAGTFRCVTAAIVDGLALLITGGSPHVSNARPDHIEQDEITVWDLRLRKLLHTIPGAFANSIVGLSHCFIQGSPSIVALDRGGRIRIHHTLTGEPTHEPWTTHTSRAISMSIATARSKTVVSVLGADRVYEEAADATGERRQRVKERIFLRAWEVPSQRRTFNHDLRSDDDPVDYVLTEMEGRPAVVLSLASHAIEVLDLRDGSRIGSLWRGHDDVAGSISVSEFDGRSVVVTAGADRTIRVWDLTATVLPSQSTDRGMGALSTVDYAQLNDKTIVIAGSGSHRATKGGHVLLLRQQGDSGAFRVLAQSGEAPESMAVVETPDGPVVVSAGRGLVHMFDVKRDRWLKKPWHAHDDGVVGILPVYANERPAVITLGADDVIKVWDVAARRQMIDEIQARHGALTAGAVAHVGGRPLLLTAGTDRRIKAWDVSRRRAVGSSSRLSDTINAVASLGSGLFVVGSGANTIVGEITPTRGTLGEVRLRFHPPTKHPAPVRRVANRDGAILVAAGDMIRILSRSGTVAAELDLWSPILDLACGPDGEILAVTKSGIVALRPR